MNQGRRRKEVWGRVVGVIIWDMPETVYNMPVYSKNVYEDAWIADPVARIEGVDFRRLNLAVVIWSAE